VIAGFAVEWFGVQVVSGVIATMYLVIVAVFTLSHIIHQMDQPVPRRPETTSGP
jgi:uncharacterized membrane protein (DUF485 family)